MFVDPRTLQRRRNRLLRGTVCAFALTLTALGVGFIPSLTETVTEAVAPKPDYHEILVTELARQHFLATNTPTIVREEAKTLEFFESQYNIRNKHLGLPPATVAAPKDGLLSFSYLAGVMD